MINQELLNKNVQKFITDNLRADLVSMRMKKSPFTGISSLELTQQIQGKKIAESKFPFLTKNDEIIYPPHLNLEQASSEITAKFKQTFISGKKGIDLTGGTGIDSLFLSQSSEIFYYVEPSKELLEITCHNFQKLNRNFIQSFNQTAENFLSENDEFFDFIYMDPSRRDFNKNKKFLLEDLIPNIIELQKDLISKSDQVYIKLSPLMDIQQTIEKINVSEIYLISVKNEMKELLVKLSKSDRKEFNPTIHCVNLESNQPDFSFQWNDEKNSVTPIYSNPEQYLLFPNASIMKAGAFKLISHQFKLKKLESNTHIYTSNIKFENFPGRIFSIIDSNFNVKKSKIKTFNIICRNYPIKIEEIKNKYKLKEGGDKYLIFTQSLKKNLCILAELN
ncbi:class I SAM-dependent methyltransferase [Apibacter raozihei]|uniref:class I SAM-dependent methyltransferase n=1 Tax=Apibacter raozihei TaxID=2500547 RepID=UPI000FE3F6B9|nr:class I SAM-dependent methyltransferase [Apibacter raozihei]